MKLIDGIYWPDDVGEKWRHAVAHVGALEWSLQACGKKRTAVQAGGNIGLWPRRMAEVFAHVYTFEPEPISRACLERNVLKNVTVSCAALGDRAGTCDMVRRSLGSHRLIEGQTIQVTTVDALEIPDLDFLQLDVEGYEWHALKGAQATVQRCHPLIQVELRGFTDKYGQTDAAVRGMLGAWGYREIAQRPGSDFLFGHRGVA
jgi:FkbM family methyltransferase